MNASPEMPSNATRPTLLCDIFDNLRERQLNAALFDVLSEQQKGHMARLRLEQ